MHEINVNPSIIRIDELRAIKNFSFIIKYRIFQMLYNAMTYNIVQILKNASQWQLNLLVLIKKQYILYVVADFYKLRVFFIAVHDYTTIFSICQYR